ncbi:cell division protein SepF [Roseburia hominis]
MGVLDKFLDVMKLSDDDDYEDDDFFDDDYDDDYEEERTSKRSLFGGKKEKQPVYEEEEEEFESRKPSRSSSSKVTPMRQPARRSTPAMEVCVIKPNNMEDAREITETLLTGRTVILNLEGLDLEIAQRIIDFTSGAAFAIDGSLQKISSFIFLVTPANVDISGDLQDLLGNSLDSPSIQNRY